MKQWDENTKLSNNFSIREFTKSQTAKRKNIDNSIQDEKIFQSLIKLCQNIVQPIREHYKLPFSPTRGYRCPALNKPIGGSATSQHCLGQAVDIEIPTVDNMNLFNFVKENLDYDQIILEYYDGVNPSSGWVHISYVSSEDNRKIAMTFDGSTYRIV